MAGNLGDRHDTGIRGHIQITSDLRGVQQTLNGLRILEHSAAGSWWGLQNLGIAFAALPSAALAGAAGAVRAASQLEDAMLGVERTVFGVADTAGEVESLGNLEQQLLDIAATKPVATVEILGVAEAAGALGVAEKDIADFTEVVVDLAATTDLTEDVAATSLARIAGLTGVAGEGFDNLASSILEAGRETAATETDIVGLATRIAPAAAVVGLAGDEVVAFSAALRSAGERSEAAGTAMQKTFFDIEKAVSSGGAELQGWARLAGMSADEFVTAWGQNAANATVRVVEGLANMNNSGQDVIGMLEALGITEARQARALLALAAAQGQNVNQNLKLTNIMEISRRAMDEGTASSDLAAQRAKTLSGQMQILVNVIQQVAASFGDDLVPIIKPIVGFLRLIVLGLGQMPPVMKAVLVIGGGLITMLSGLLAVLFLVGPRIAIGVGALLNFIRSLQVGMGATGAFSSAVNRMTFSLGGASTALSRSSLIAQTWANTQARAAIVASNSLTIYQKNAMLAALASQRLGGSANFAAVGLANVGRGARLASLGMRALGIATAVLTAGTIILGKRESDRLAQQEEMTRANTDLVAAMQHQRKTGEDLTSQWVAQKVAQDAALRSAQRYGYTQEQIGQIIKGSMDIKSVETFINTLGEAAKAGDKNAQTVLTTTNNLRKQFNASQEEAGISSRALAGVGDAAESMGEDMDDAADSVRDLHTELTNIAQAHLDYVDSLFAQREAQFSLIDAQDAYNEALSNAANPARVLLRYELQLREAQLAHQEALRDLAEARENATIAQTVALEDLADAEDDLADANDSYLDSLDKIRDLEEEIAELRAGPSMLDYLKATNDLKNAQLSLLRAHQSVADAEWYLNFLRQEGAGARDIQEAELILAESRQDVADAQEDVMESEEELAELRDDTARLEKLARLERDLASARRDSERALRDIARSERDLADAREDMATATVRAEQEVVEARLRVQETALAVRDAEQELAKIRSGSLRREVERAELALEQAYYRVAQANTEVTKQTALMRGETWHAGREAHTLAGQLAAMADSIPVASISANMQEVAEVLRRAPSEAIDEVEQRLGGIEDSLDSAFDLGPIEDFAIGAGDLIDDLFADIEAAAEEASKRKPSFLETLLGAGPGGGLGSILGGTVGTSLIRRFIPSLLTKLAGKGIGGAVGTALGGPIGLVIGVALGAAIEYFWDDIWRIGGTIVEGIVGGIQDNFGKTMDQLSPILEDLREFGGDIVGGIWEGIEDAWEGFLDFIGSIFDKGFIGTVKGILGIGSPSKVFSEIGKDIIRGLIGGIGNMISELGRMIGSAHTTIINTFSGAGQWLIQKGRNVLQGLIDGIFQIASTVGNFLKKNVHDPIINFFAGAVKWLFEKGRSIFIGLRDGIYNTAKDVGFFLVQHVYNPIINFFGGAINWLWNAGRAIIEGLVNGLRDNAWKITTGINDFIVNPFGSFIDWIDEGSPSRLFAMIGQSISEGLAAGIESSSDEVARSMDDVRDLLSLADVEDLRSDLAVGTNLRNAAASAAAAGGSSVRQGDTINFRAVTSADPNEVVNAYFFQKRVRTRG